MPLKPGLFEKTPSIKASDVGIFFFFVVNFICNLLLFKGKSLPKNSQVKMRKKTTVFL